MDRKKCSQNKQNPISEILDSAEIMKRMKKEYKKIEKVYKNRKKNRKKNIKNKRKNSYITIIS